MGPSLRPYAEVLEAWRTSCPRLPAWEDDQIVAYAAGTPINVVNPSVLERGS